MSKTETHARYTAWDLIGFEAPHQIVKIAGGRVGYTSVDYRDDTPGGQVRLAKLVVTPDGIRQISRYVHPDTPLIVCDDDGTAGV